MAKPAVLIVGADKGGVGKTTVSRTLLDYFAAHQIPTRAFDTEAPKGTLKRFYPDASEIVDMNLVPDQMKIFDTLSASHASVTVIDVRAGLLSPTLQSLRAIPTKKLSGQAASYSFVLRGYVRHWLGNVWAEYDRIKLTDLVASRAQADSIQQPRAAAG